MAQPVSMDLDGFARAGHEDLPRTRAASDSPDGSDESTTGTRTKPWRESLQELLEEFGIEEVEDGVLELLFSAACNEASILLHTAKGLKQGSQLQHRRQQAAAPQPSIAAADVRLAAALKRGRAPDALEAKKKRETRNKQPMPSVMSNEGLDLPMECLLTGQDYSLEPSRASAPLKVKAMRAHLKSNKYTRDKIRARHTVKRGSKI